MKISATIVFLVFAGSAFACSVCRCGDNGFQFSEQTLIPSNAIGDRNFHLSFSNYYSAKSSALSPDEGIGTERQNEFRPAVRAAYQFPWNLTLTGELPFSMKHLKTIADDGSETERSSGLGDAEFTASWVKGFYSGPGWTYSSGLSIALKVPSGQNNLKEDGARRDEHLQAGTGSYDYTIGGGLARSTPQSRIFLSAYYRHNGVNDYEYHYGNAALLNLGIQRSIKSWLDGSIQINSRYANRDLEQEEKVDNTGGSVAYFTPGLKANLGNVTSFVLSLQIPVWQNLYGQQSEKAVLITGFSFRL